jgi:general secretion pathway protein L
VRTLELPQAVRRRVGEVIPFELEAQLPFDLDDAVFDFRVRAGAPMERPFPVLVAAARVEDVRERIDQVARAIGRQPDHVGPGAFPLADLAAPLAPFRQAGVRAVLDLGADQSELVVLEGAEPIFARTISRGIVGMPQTAGHLVRELRQSIAAFKSATGLPLEMLFLTGGGAYVIDLPRWLSGELQLDVDLLPLGGIEGLAPDRRDGAHRFARAVGLALGCAPRARGLDLRRGPLAYERGYGFLREKVPLLAGLGATILVAFLFATWARTRNANADRKALEAVLAESTKEILGEATTDPERANELLQKGPTSTDDDPLPRADAMDVMVQISELIPTGKMKHDIEKLEVSRQAGGGFKVSLQGIAPTVADVNTIEASLKTYRCFNNASIPKKVKAVNSENQKYTFEAELRCPEEGGGPKKSATTAGSAAPSAGGAK